MEALTIAQIRSLMEEKIAGSALSEADARVMALKPCTGAEAKKLGLAAEAGCFLIPYFTLTGKPTKFFRARYVQDTRKGFDKLAGKKALRYAQPPDTESELYMPPMVKWARIAADPAQPIIITEGELKAACTSKHGWPCLGLGGVWSFQSAKHGQPLIPVFDDFVWQDRVVFIIYDSDAVTNPKVVAAETRLAARLLERGAQVRIGRLPPSDQIAKVGLDDYIVLNGPETLQKEVIDKSFPYATSQALHKLNERVVYVRDPGFIWDHENRQKLTPGGFKEHAFSNYHYTETRMVADKPVMVKKPAAKAWLEWEHRGEVRGLTFEPGGARITEDQLLNTWSGWGVDNPRKGDVEPWQGLLGHLFGKDADAHRWFEQWCAYPLQNPGAKMVTAAAIWGPVHGSGKSLIGYTLMKIYGVHCEELKDDDLDSERKEWAQDLQFVMADDITARGDRQFMRRLMTMVTQKYIRLDPKYIPSYKLPDLMNWYFTSNDPDALFMDDQDRRFFIHETQAGKYTHYRGYYKPWMESDDGISALWHHLLTLDMTGFDPSAEAPETLGKSSMIELGKSDLGAWVRELRDNGAAMLSKAGMKGELFTAKELHALYDPAGQKKASPNALARELKRAGIVAPGNGSKLHMSDGTQLTAYAVINRPYWKEASWKLACAHFEEHRPPAGQRAKKKF